MVQSFQIFLVVPIGKLLYRTLEKEEILKESAGNFEANKK